MSSRLLRLWVAVIVLSLSIGTLLVSAWPVAREQHQIALPILTLPTPENETAASGTRQPAIPEARTIVIDQPARVRVLDDDWVMLTVAIDPAAQPQTGDAGGDNLYETHNVVAVARLELAQVGAWREALREPLRPGRPVTFRWTIRAEEAAAVRGVVWLSLEFVPLAGGEVQTSTVLSRPLMLQAVSILGQPAWLARVVGGVGLVIGVLVCFSLALPAAQGGRQGGQVNLKNG